MSESLARDNEGQGLQPSQLFHRRSQLFLHTRAMYIKVLNETDLYKSTQESFTLLWRRGSR